MVSGPKVPRAEINMDQVKALNKKTTRDGTFEKNKDITISNTQKGSQKDIFIKQLE